MFRLSAEPILLASIQQIKLFRFRLFRFSEAHVSPLLYITFRSAFMILRLSKKESEAGN